VKPARKFGPGCMSKECATEILTSERIKELAGKYFIDVSYMPLSDKIARIFGSSGKFVGNRNQYICVTD
jgi:hypothetical protein